MTSHTHQSHPDIIKRLKRAGGHLESVTRMIEEERSCLEVAQQLHAVEKAIQQAKRTLIQDHIDHCLDEAIAPQAPGERARVDDFKTIVRYL
ncbi:MULTISPECIES: metal-sensing transcriptional repressor [Halomonas]|uniref:metal-sensing transcriptional repressor n=1 Tax=Halomonas TaxID=2745 RepID=UPI001C94F3C7|nr:MULTISPECIES: metal-sensing transcriptional repressor [Halomonas]MBY5926318.1 metal-sensing transcriptional repressor [Halomonas sp. DP4Y7-2]MBY6209731.1 metal-sensing transcriptional repressor [Halomonas sp. DP3Y7-2]MBY6229950.1 metal-sensing transcriptional repressor [Halomonas sp. DP3Y7-1]MBY6233360.1 metal-sensing transcriptional repressor [Halomonas sp. DP4Y7-1]MCA0918235.1 metal-sensing transcriptional repressor [Halomonas denitrificans]